MRYGDALIYILVFFCSGRNESLFTDLHPPNLGAQRGEYTYSGLREDEE